MVLKAISMGVPILVSRSGFTKSAVHLARKFNLSMIGRFKGKKIYVCKWVRKSFALTFSNKVTVMCDINLPSVILAGGRSKNEAQRQIVSRSGR